MLFRSRAICITSLSVSYYHDLRSDQNAESRTQNQYDTDSDVMQIARAFVPIAPSGPSSHDPCRCPHIQKNGSGIDDQTNPEGHATEIRTLRPRQTYYTTRSLVIMRNKICSNVGEARREAAMAKRKRYSMVEIATKLAQANDLAT